MSKPGRLLPKKNVGHAKGRACCAQARRYRSFQAGLQVQPGPVEVDRDRSGGQHVPHHSILRRPGNCGGTGSLPGGLRAAAAKGAAPAVKSTTAPFKKRRVRHPATERKQSQRPHPSKTKSAAPGCGTKAKSTTAPFKKSKGAAPAQSTSVGWKDCGTDG